MEGTASKLRPEQRQRQVPARRPTHGKHIPRTRIKKKGNPIVSTTDSIWELQNVTTTTMMTTTMTPMKVKKTKITVVIASETYMKNNMPSIRRTNPWATISTCGWR